MDFQEMFLNEHAGIHSGAVTTGGDWNVEDNLCKELTAEQLRQCPWGTINSVAWMLWHMARVEDVAVNTALRGVEEVLDRGDWLPRLGVTTRHLAIGDTKEEVRQFSERVDVSALRAYRAAVGKETRSWMAEADLAALEGVVTREGVQLARERGAFGERAAYIATRWESGWPKAPFLLYLAVEHNHFHFGQAWLMPKLLRLADG